MTKDKDCVLRLRGAGFSLEDANSLRRIAMTLHRWHELECGDGNDFASWCITRGKKLSAHQFQHDENGKPYLETHYHSGTPQAYYEAIPDREKGALKRLAAVMKRYPDFVEYVQTDLRGASLYICKRSETPQPLDQYYSRGIAVYK